MTQLSTLAAGVAAQLKQNRQSIAVAESSTGGLISSALLAIPGASSYFLGGAVVYTIEARRELLGLSDQQLTTLQPLTEEYVAVCARSIRQKLGATWGIAELGATGPAGTRYGHEPGICVLAIDGPVELTRLIETGSGDREANMWRFVEAAIELLNQAMNQ
ncbi:MAG: CinA family protein [Immundisolibacteraceae bacterium]|nr:CinA family protein [Immundisolibacteraceae bacterium]